VFAVAKARGELVAVWTYVEAWVSITKRKDSTSTIKDKYADDQKDTEVATLLEPYPLMAQVDC
jgi:hypothetical protein